MTHSRERFYLKLLKTDKDALESLAINEGETMSVIVRRLIRRELTEQGYIPIDKSGKQMKSVLK